VKNEKTQRFNCGILPRIPLKEVNKVKRWDSPSEGKAVGSVCSIILDRWSGILTMGRCLLQLGIRKETAS